MAKKTNEAKDLKALVAEKVAGSGGEIRNRVVDIMAEQEIAVRVDKARAATELLGKARKELEKAGRPDLKTYDAEGKEVLHFSADLHKRKKELEEAVAGLEEAIEACLTSNTAQDYQKLDKATGKASGLTK